MFNSTTIQLGGFTKTDFKMADILYGDIMPLIWVFPQHMHLHKSCIHVSRLGMSLGIQGFDKIYINIRIS